VTSGSNNSERGFLQFGHPTLEPKPEPENSLSELLKNWRRHLAMSLQRSCL